MVPLPPSAPRSDAGENVSWKKKKKKLIFADKWLSKCWKVKGKPLCVEAPGYLWTSQQRQESRLELPRAQDSTLSGERSNHTSRVSSYGWAISQIFCQSTFAPHRVLQNSFPAGQSLFPPWIFSSYRKLMPHITQLSNSCWWINVSVQGGGVAKRTHPV